MPSLSAFGTPARQQDFPSGSAEQQQLDAWWSTRVEGFTQQAIVGNPWTSQYQSDQTCYYDPLVTDIPTGTAAVLVSWVAFPNRLNQYLGQAQSPPQNPYNLSDDDILRLADTGGVAGTQAEFKQIPTVHCPLADWSGTLGPYGPYGPRGWLDEYCEWSVTRNSEGKIVRVDFVCENPEYWYTLWQVDPSRVAAIYQQTLNLGVPTERQITVTVEDLQLVDPATGKPVIDPSTGRPAYNPLNKWNTGTVSTRKGSASDTGGAMHLTSTPNTLQTELGLAGGASVLRQLGNSDPQALICCGVYGQSYRNSDPHIGQAVNEAVSGSPPSQSPAIVSLADPVGLYIQPPENWELFTAPGTLDPQDCWQVLRGASTLHDPVTGGEFPGAFMLHVAFQIPDSWPAGMTVEDIQIADAPIQFAGQIARTFQVGLYPRPIPATLAKSQPCVPANPPTVSPQPLQLFYANLWDAYYATAVTNPVDQPMSLASNSVIVPPRVPAGASGLRMALTCAAVTPGRAPTITFQGAGDVQVSNVSEPTTVSYAVPGNTYPSPCQLVTFELSVSADAAAGGRGVVIVNPGQAPGEWAPAFLEVVAPS
jgi:hypothetical protein